MARHQVSVIRCVCTDTNTLRIDNMDVTLPNLISDNTEIEHESEEVAQEFQHVEPTSIPMVIQQDNSVTVSAPFHPGEWSSELTTDGLLDRYSLVIDCRYQVMICRLCSHAVAPVSIYGHVKKNHPQMILSEDLRVDALRRLYPKLVENPVAISPSVLPCPPVPFLAIHQGFTCFAAQGSPACFRSMLSKRRLLQHIQEDHSRGQYSAKEALLQTYFDPIPKLYFPINNVTGSSVNQAGRTRAFAITVNSLKEEILPVQVVPSSDKEVHPFFRHNRWFNFLSQYEPKQLAALVSGEARQGFEYEKKVQPSILEYFKDIRERIASMTPAVMKVLSIKDE